MSAPDISGLWQSKHTEVLQDGQFIPEEETQIEIKQRGNFVTFRQLTPTPFRPEPSVRLGVWRPTLVANNKILQWELVLTDAANSISFVQVVKSKDDCPAKLWYNYIQSGSPQIVVESHLVKV